MNGTYHYWMNGTQTDITETFRIISTLEAETVIESERLASAFLSRIAVTAGSYLKVNYTVRWNDGADHNISFSTIRSQ